MKTRPFINLLSVLLVCCLAMDFFTGCSGSSTSGGGTGELSIGLTDAEGDFVTYSVDVVSITLTKANGAVVETLPASTRVDFSQYTEMTEFLTAAMVPLGAYKKATLKLDYTNADIRVEDSSGESIKASSIIDDAGNTVNETDVSVYLENRSALVVAPGATPHITFDFDLKASNVVTFDSQGNAEIVVEPSLIAQVNHESHKMHRLRGRLGEVAVDERYFYLDICPFHHKLNGKQKKGGFGRIAVLSETDTLFDINGDMYRGETGLATLSMLAPGSAAIVKGKLKFNPRRFYADEVYTGTSVPGTDLDVVSGNVIARDGNTLTVKGATLIRDTGEVEFDDIVLVTVGEGTVVKKQHSIETYTIDAASPGQRLSVSGVLQFVDNKTPHLDATEGTARLLITTLRGTSIENTGSPLIIGLDAIDMKNVDMFDFTGTGSDASNDADPLYYEINTGELDISGFTPETPLKAFGFINHFGRAPEDFIASSLVNLSTITAFIKVHWAPPSKMPFSDISEEGLVINLEGTRMFHHFGRGGTAASLSTLGGPPVVKPSESGIYVIQTHGPGTAYTDFSAFTNELQQLLDGHKESNKLFVYGLLDTVTSTITADYLVIKIH